MIKTEKNLNKAIRVLLLSASLLVTGCSVSPPPSPPPEFVTTVVSEKNSNTAQIDVKPNWEQASLTNNAGISGLSTTIKNNTNKIVRIVWEKSSVSYGGHSHLPFITGQKFINASTPASPTVIPANGSDTKMVFSSDQPFYASAGFVGWRVRTIQANQITLVLCVVADGIEDYYTIEIKRK